MRMRQTQEKETHIICFCVVSSMRCMRELKRFHCVNFIFTENIV